MAVLRAVSVALLLLVFLAVGLPVQWACRRLGRAFPRRLPIWFCRALLAVVGMKLAVRGEAPGAGVRLLVANHVSWLDVPALLSRDPMAVLAKREVGTWPVIRSFAAMLEVVFIERGRRMAIPCVNRDMADRLARGRSVLLFPEGTTHDGLALGRFGTAHLACLRDRMNVEPGLGSCLVQPVLVAYSSPAAAWLGDDELIPHLWRMLTGPRVTCTLVYGTPVSVPRGFDRKALGRTLAVTIEDLRRQALPSRPAVETTAEELPENLPRAAAATP